MDEDLESGTKTPPTQAPRSRLLLSCSESILAVAESAYRRVEASSCAVGCLARGVSHVAAPVLRPLRLRPRCLSALCFVDRQLAVAQDVAAVLFPRAERVLGKVDGFVLLVESLPVRFDGAVDGLEALVAGVRSGVAARITPARLARRADKGTRDVFRDIRCDEKAVHRDAEKMCEDVSPEAESLGVVTVITVDDGSGGDDGGVGGEIKTNSCVDSADKITGEDMARSDEPGSDERKGEVEQMNFDISGAEQRSEGVRREQDRRSMETAETQVAEVMEAAQSTEVVKVESQQAVSPEVRSTSETGEARSSDGDLLDLFDEAWQHKLA